MYNNINPAVKRELIKLLTKEYGSPDYSRVYEWEGTKVIATIEAGVEGEIFVGEMEFWDSIGAEWVSSPPTLPVDSDMGFRVPVRNTGSYKQHMKLRAEVARPGKTYGVDIEVYHSVEAGETELFEFGTDFPGVYNFPSGEEEGSYTVVSLILYADVY